MDTIQNKYTSLKLSKLLSENNCELESEMYWAYVTSHIREIQGKEPKYSWVLCTASFCKHYSRIKKKIRSPRNRAEKVRRRARKRARALNDPSERRNRGSGNSTVKRLYRPS